MAAEDTGDDASIALLHRLRAGATVHFVHHVDVCSAAPEDLVADLEPAPGTSVWYLYCVKKYKSAHGRPGGHRQRAIAASDTCWHSEAGAKDVKGSQGGGTVCNLSYGRKDGRSFTRLGWCMMEYDDATGGGDHVLCKIYRSPRAQGKPSSAASKTSSGSKRKAGGEHTEARPAKLLHEQDTFFTNDYAMPSTVAQVNVGGEEEQHLSTQDGEFVQTMYGLLPSVVAQINVEEWIRGAEMFGGDEEQQSSKPEQDDWSVKDYLLAPETTSGEASGVPATLTPPDDADLFDVELDSEFSVLQEQHTWQMQQPHAAEADPMAEFAHSLQTPRAMAMALIRRTEDSVVLVREVRLRGSWMPPAPWRRPGAPSGAWWSTPAGSSSEERGDVVTASFEVPVRRCRRAADSYLLVAAGAGFLYCSELHHDA
uniref:NAC domain-containing protein n=1 Tax=Setaria viridis TaxID=4556 RepID=A0A4U6SP82_SETVI|nr:hypothetical protein SEVIR_9G025200v2 [Setaria viridis]